MGSRRPTKRSLWDFFDGFACLLNIVQTDTIGDEYGIGPAKAFGTVNQNGTDGGNAIRAAVNGGQQERCIGTLTCENPLHSRH